MVAKLCLCYEVNVLLSHGLKPLKITTVEHLSMKPECQKYPQQNYLRKLFQFI